MAVRRKGPAPKKWPEVNIANLVLDVEDPNARIEYRLAAYFAILDGPSASQAQREKARASAPALVRCLRLAGGRISANGLDYFVDPDGRPACGLPGGAGTGGQGT